MRLDAHQHFWKYSPTEYPWMQEDWPIRRDFLPHDLEPHLQAAGLNGCIAVQARQTVAETEWLLELARHNPIIKGVVGWVDLRSPNVSDDLARFARDTKFIGVRHVVQDEPDDDFMLGDAFQNGIAKLVEHDLAYDILIFPKQLPAAIELVRNFAAQRFVLDHMAKPKIAAGEMSPWREGIQKLAALPNITCKVSGMVTEAQWDAWKPTDFTPYLDVVFQAFGPQRLMYGSDWPVSLLSAPYEKSFQLIETYAERFSTADHVALFGGTAQKFYRV